ncbi:4-coumarate--CoA ligase family protein [Streptomyces tateyamensis]|uniref:4-coumarate--CoA ligase family protein n=1 Tax=Streptomyces tateyamensis TaxID=565073 RepID=A0A2V4NXY6_9ACTN|nr:AMP-binding protein [Streptomyces tateyamensis]PYC76695.1 4-coumarate--CoA ligase family protein [Streptomyces tateyamensis]
MFRSQYPDVPAVELPLHEAVLGDSVQWYADTPALIDGLTGASVSYRELGEAVDRVAAGLAEAGLVKGDVLALHSYNAVRYPIALYGAIKAGATVTTVSSLATPEELAGQLRDSGARWIISALPLSPVALAAAEGLEIRETFLLDGTDGVHRTLDDLLAAAGPAPQVAIDPARDLAILPYSSGTTGLPKGVMLTHRSIATNLAQVAAVHATEPGERVIGILPFFHIYGLSALLNRALRAGGTMVVLPRFDLEQFLRVIQEYRIEAVPVAPPIVLALAKHPLVDAYDLSSIRYVLSAAAPLDAALAAAAADRLGLPTIHQGYGMTELSPATHLVPLDDPEPSPGAVGKLVAATELRVLALDGSGRDLGIDEDGEILIRGPQVMMGYFGRPHETDTMIDSEGWLHTGDVGHQDARGYLHVVDRVKELIKYKGYQVAPAELEALLLTHPQIADAAVIGVTDDEGTERPKAFVVPAPGAELTEQQVIDFVADRVAPYKKVRAVAFLAAVPKSASGKILRRELRGK